MSAILIEKISRHFGEVVAVDAIDLRVEDGEFVTLLGPSGCGKTTTLRMVAGLERNTGGRISIDGRVVSDAAENFFLAPERRGLGMVFQSYAIWPHMTVFDNVAYPLRIRRRSRAEIDERVAKALRLVEMEPYAQRPAPALSGGQQQRVAIARALVFEPSVLLLDEPLSNLDARLRAQMGDEFRALQKRLGLTTLYVTHDQAEAMALSDRVVVMQNGHILQTGSPQDVYLRPQSRAVAAFFGVPNILEAKVTACRAEGDGRFLLNVQGTGWAGVCHAAQAYEAGATIHVMIRSEHFALADARDVPKDIQLSGKVVETIFRGAHCSVTIDSPAGPLNVDLSSLAHIKVGDTIALRVEPGAAWAISR